LKVSGWSSQFSIGNPQSAIENELVQAAFQCAGCGQWNQTTVDESAGRSQSYTEDCQVCCKPNLLRVRYDRGEQEFVISADLE
jgi:Cysteine-rich CPXCG